MHIQTIATTAALLLLALQAGCKKTETTTTQGETPNIGGIQVNQGPGGAVTTDAAGVTRYNDEGPEIGTVTLRRSATARKAADQTSDIVARPGQGSAVNKKARHGGYYLVEVPTGPNEMKLGWIEQNDVHSPAPPVTTTVATATATTTATTTVTTAVGGRPAPIRINLPKK
jgi:hypothetical protein